MQRIGSPQYATQFARAKNLMSYNLSLTAASLRPELARIVAECYIEAGGWEPAKASILSSNALQSRSASSSIRLERELRRRLATLTNDQMILLSQATAEDRAAMAWLATCKSITFAFEFASEVLREKLEAHDVVLRHSDYEAYVENKGVAHPELNRLAPSSKAKIRRNLLGMLNEAGLLVKGAGAVGTIQRPVLSPEVLRVITSDSPRWLAGFLVPDNEFSNL